MAQAVLLPSARPSMNVDEATPAWDGALTHCLEHQILHGSPKGSNKEGVGE